MTALGDYLAVRAGKAARARDKRFRARLWRSIVTATIVITWPLFGMWVSGRLIAAESAKGVATGMSNLTGGKMTAKSRRWKTPNRKVGGWF